MFAVTENVIIKAPIETVYDLVSDIEQLPHWALEFAPRLERVDGWHKAINAQGEYLVRFESDPKTGVIDMFVGPDELSIGRLPTRVVELAANVTLFSFTLVQPPAMPPEVFEAQRSSIARELEILKHKLEAA